MGGIDLSSPQVPWYVARNTVDGVYAAGMFIPPQTGCTLILQYADEEVEIPLRLEQEKAESCCDQKIS